jgi:hypothetical protein
MLNNFERCLSQNVSIGRACIRGIIPSSKILSWRMIAVTIAEP